MENNLIKLVQRKRSNESDANKNRRKRTQRNAENSNVMPVAGTSNDNQHLLSSSIFKLNGHCFDELFEYLSLKDLHSLGQTCKSMQQVTGEFFKRNYSAAKFNCLSDGIYMLDTDSGCNLRDRIDKCVPIPGFNKFVTWIAIENNVVAKEGFRKDKFTYYFDYHHNLSKFKYIKLHSDEFQSVKKLSLTNVRSLNKRIVGYILKILPNIEVLELNECTVTQNLYGVLLKYCKNLRHITLDYVTFKTKCNDWLLQRYEKLERFELKLYDEQRIDELSTFLECNPNIRSFSCDSQTLLSNKDTLLNSKVKLDAFELKCIFFVDEFEKKPLWDLLYQLHTNGFFNRLHIKAWREFSCDQLSSIPFLEQLSLADFDLDSLEPFSTHLIEYAETQRCYTPWNYIYETGKSRNEIFAERLMNVERLHLYRETLDILLFIKKLRNLRKIKLFGFKSAEILQLDMLNTEREKLAGAQKVTVYVPDAVFLATKWATKNGITNFSLIEMKRTDSYEWLNTWIYLSGYVKRLHLPPGMK